MPAITALNPSPRPPRRLVIMVDGKTVATLPPKLVEALGLALGQAWDDALAAKVADAVLYAQALRRATRAIDRRALSGAQTDAKLAAAGYAPPLRQRVLQRLEELGLVNDLELGRKLIEELSVRKPAGPALWRAKLLARGLDETLVEQLIREAAQAPDADPLLQAQALARQRLASMAKLTPMAQKRRLWGLLARRGFDSQTIQAALEGLPGLEDFHAD